MQPCASLATRLRPGHYLLQSVPFHTCSVRSSTNPNSRDGVEQSKNVEEPQHHSNHYDCVQDRLDAACHGDKTVHEPQQNSNHD
jgi:hypothetical protein